MSRKRHIKNAARRLHKDGYSRSLFDTAHPARMFGVANRPSEEAMLTAAQFEAAHTALSGTLENKPRQLVVPIVAIPFLVDQGIITQEQAEEALKPRQERVVCSNRVTGVRETEDA